MRIAIDARMMGAGSTRGIGRYIEELVRAMFEVAPEHEYILIVRNQNHDARRPIFDARLSTDRPYHFETIVADIPWYGLAEQLKMPRILNAARADIVHIPHWNAPLLYHGPFVVTIHDLLLRHEPLSAKISTRGFCVRALKRLGYRLTLDHAIAAAQKILVPTSCVADDVASLYPRASSKIVVTGEGMPVPDVTSGHRDIRRDESRPYLLYVGSAYPHKGLEDLLAAWQLVARAHPQLALVIAGEMDVFMRRMRDLAEQKHLPRISFLGRVSDPELHKLYTHAAALVYPTHFEGFGLPPLEAIASGCPVIASDISPLKEVLGVDGAVFFRAGDASAILSAVTHVIQHEAELRQRLPELAERLACRHDWRQTAARTLAAYQGNL